MANTVIGPATLVEAGIFSSEEDAIRASIDALLTQHAEMRIDVAVHLYARERRISLAKAAEIAGVHAERMKIILDDRGVPLRLGPATIEEARREYEAVERSLRAGAP